jgi:hypothetical protein
VVLAEHARADPFADRVVAYQIGVGGGAGQDKMPGIVLGPPHGGGAFQGSTDTLSLGLGGWIVLEFTDGLITDGPGPDFTVFENPFLLQGTVTESPFAEPGTVSVSADGVTWRTFPCHVDAPPYYPGCAGVYPVFANVDNPTAPSPLVPCTTPIQALVGVPIDTFAPPACSGGDSFDLTTVGLATARFVRIDASQLQPGGGGTAGFDLDAVAAVHFLATAEPSSTTTIATASTTTSTTVPLGCWLGMLPADPLAGVQCAIGALRGTLNAPPQPACGGRCRQCSLEPPLDRIAGLVSQADGARTRKRCRAKLDTARHAAKSLSARIASLTRRNCLAPVGSATTLEHEAVDLLKRTTALSKSGFCANKWGKASR